MKKLLMITGIVLGSALAVSAQSEAKPVKTEPVKPTQVELVKPSKTTVQAKPVKVVAKENAVAKEKQVKVVSEKEQAKEVPFQAAVSARVVEASPVKKN